VLNAFLLDHVDVDLELLNRLNNVIRDGTTAFGTDFVRAMTNEAHKRNQPPYSLVNAFTLRPTEDMGRLASEHVRRGKLTGNPFLTKRLIAALDVGVGDEADLASYLLFDGQFCRQLIEMGRADAHAHRDEILEFFGHADDDGGGITESQDSSHWDKPSMTLPIGT
jgi:NTE family protein